MVINFKIIFFIYHTFSAVGPTRLCQCSSYCYWILKCHCRDVLVQLIFHNHSNIREQSQSRFPLIRYQSNILHPTQKYTCIYMYFLPFCFFFAAIMLPSWCYILLCFNLLQTKLFNVLSLSLLWWRDRERLQKCCSTGVGVTHWPLINAAQCRLPAPACGLVMWSPSRTKWFPSTNVISILIIELVLQSL